MRKALLLLLTVASSAHPAFAQVSGAEYLAAYCLGVVEQRGREGLASSLGEEAGRQEAAFLGRIGRHLQIKIGTRTPAAQLRALFVAKQGGVVGQTECTSRVESNSAVTSAQCIDKCRAPITDSELCYSCVITEVKAEACTRVAQCKPAPLPPANAAGSASPAPVPAPQPSASLAKQQSLSDAQERQPADPTPGASSPRTRPAPTTSFRNPQEGSQYAKAADRCTVSRPKPGRQVYLVSCPGSWVMIGRTVDKPTDWTVSEGANSNDAIAFFMKNR